jgi:hypothetical protein
MDELNLHKNDVLSLKQNQNELKIIIENKADTIKETMLDQVKKMDTEMQKHFSQQKAENSRLMQQITQLNGEKTAIQNLLNALKKRIDDIQLQIENDNN